VRRLAIVILVAALAGPAAQAFAQDADASSASGTAPVDVFKVTGLVDAVLANGIERAIERAESNGSQALVLQMNSKGAVVSRARMERLAQRIANAAVPVAIWVGPSGSRATGLAGQLLGAAAATGMAGKTKIGNFGEPLTPEGVTMQLGDAADALKNDTVGAADARQLGLVRIGSKDPTIEIVKNMIAGLDGMEYRGKVLDTATETVKGGTTQQELTAARFSDLGLADRLFHTVASPPIAYLLFITALALLIFEFYTAGVGLAGLVGAVCLVLGCYGIGALPVRGWAVGLIVASMLASAIDVQVGIPRFWTGVGLVGNLIGALWMFREGLSLSWVTLSVGMIGIALAFIVGMPSMVRTRFATPTIGREWMIGEMGEAVLAVDPEGVVEVRGAQWRARTNRATPIGRGDRVRVTAIDGVTLEVEPERGGARDYRERRPKDNGDQASSDSAESVSSDSAESASGSTN
jgi:membrane-bound serine protease (ClpP class)